MKAMIEKFIKSQVKEYLDCYEGWQIHSDEIHTYIVNYVDDYMIGRHGETHNIKSYDKMERKIMSWVENNWLDKAQECEYEYECEY